MFIPLSLRDILGLLIERCTTTCYHCVGLNPSQKSWHTFPHNSGRWVWRQKTRSRALLPALELLLLKNKFSSILHQFKLLLRAAECSFMKLFIILLILYRKS